MSQIAPPLAGVLGMPIAHSKSPRLFAHWFAVYGLEAHYIPMAVEADDFESCLRALPKLGFQGVNVTLPHKERALELADHPSERALSIGAANTLTFGPDGAIHADNTDGFGFSENLRAGAPRWQPETMPALVLGAGGASRAVLQSLLELGTPRVLLSNRTETRAQELAAQFGDRVQVVPWSEAHTAISDAALVINTTSLGMTGKPPLDLPLTGLRPEAIVTDLVYAPLETPFLAAAREAGCTVVDGLGMLLHQAVPGFERWFGTRPEVTAETRGAVL